MNFGGRFVRIVLSGVFCLSTCFTLTGCGESTEVKAQGAGLPAPFKVGARIDRGDFYYEIKELSGNWMRVNEQITESARQRVGQRAAADAGREAWLYIPNFGNGEYKFVGAATPAR